MTFISSAKHSSGKEDGNTASVPTASTNVPTTRLSEARTEEEETTSDRDHALVANEVTPTEFALMANTSVESKVFDNSLCSKDCKKNNDSLDSKITDLTDKLFDANNFIYYYKLALAQEGVDGKLAGLLTALMDLDNLIESQRSEKNKEGLGYTTVPPSTAQLYLSPNKDLSWTGLLKCADDTVTDYSRPSSTIE
nr:hypothetical protein [Tanacetum cinerariifolium]